MDEDTTGTRRLRAVIESCEEWRLGQHSELEWSLDALKHAFRLTIPMAVKLSVEAHNRGDSRPTPDFSLPVVQLIREGIDIMPSLPVEVRGYEDWPMGDGLPIPSDVVESITEEQVRFVAGAVDSSRPHPAVAMLYCSLNFWLSVSESAQLEPAMESLRKTIDNVMLPPVVLLLGHVYLTEHNRARFTKGIAFRERSAAAAEKSVLKIQEALDRLSEALAGQRLPDRVRTTISRLTLVERMQKLRDILDGEKEKEWELYSELLSRLPLRQADYLPTQKRALVSVRELLRGAGVSDLRIATVAAEVLAAWGFTRDDESYTGLSGRVESLRINLPRWSAEMGVS